MKHLDFTNVIILDIEGSRIDIERAESRQPCECCMQSAEYVLHSDWDPLHQSDVYECQGCLIDGMSNPMVDTYIFVAA